jgi:hypothetical protein
MKKTLKMVAWGSGILGVVLMLLGIIAFVAGGKFMSHFWSSYFFPASNFLLLGVFLFLGLRLYDE